MPQQGRDTTAKLNRRKFLASTARNACGVAAFGLLLGLYAKQAKSLPADALRPPGAGTEDQFLAACLRCGLCVRDCPYGTLKLSQLGNGPATGSPYFTARDVPCEMYDDIPCVAACPSGALSKELTNIDDSRMGIAILSDRETCLNVRGLRCDVCYRVCPLMGKAITLEMQANKRTGKHASFIPTIHSESCTGCGKCEKSCVLEEAAIKVFPRSLTKGRMGDHYRLGWIEKEKAGKSLMPGIIDLPDRMPGGRL